MKKLFTTLGIILGFTVAVSAQAVEVKSTQTQNDDTKTVTKITLKPAVDATPVKVVTTEKPVIDATPAKVKN